MDYINQWSVEDTFRNRRNNMPMLIPILTKMVGSTLLSMAMSLVTKKFVKKVIIAALEKLVKATKDDTDDKLLAAAKEAWNEKG